MNGEAHPRVRYWFWAAVVITLIKLWLVRGQAIYAIGPADHDDRLFLQLAEHLTRGDWLGPYNQLTLAKGPFYPLWVAFVYVLGLPLFFAQNLLYAGACALFVRACRPAIASGAARFGIYALLLWNPMSFEASSMGRVLRQHVYGPLELLMFAALIAFYFRRSQPLRRLLPWAALLGLAFAAFWLTREESIWIVPSLMLLADPTLVSAWRASRGHVARLGPPVMGVAPVAPPADSHELQRVVRVFAFSLLCAAIPLLAVCGMNYAHYRWFGTVETNSAAFKDAYGAMLRVNVGPTLPFVAVTREARAAMYAASPAFAELRPHFEGGIGRDWAESSEALTHLPPEERQIGNGWMMWALRDAVAAAGHGQNAKRAQKFCRRMADEINQACDEGRLPAGSPRSGFLPPWRAGQTALVAQKFAEFGKFVVGFQSFSASAPPSIGTPEDLALFRKMTRERLSPGPGTLMQPPPSPRDEWKTATLQRIGNGLRPLLLGLFWLAQALVVLRAAQLAWQRRGSLSFLLAVAAWGAGVVYLLINALIEVTSFPVLAIMSFAPVYPLVLVFIVAVFWDVLTAWGMPRWRADVGR